MKKYLLLLAGLVLNHLLPAQDFNRYQPLRVQGSIPPQFIETATHKYEADRASINDKKRRTRKAKEEFYLKSNFGLQEILMSGRVMFNDPLTAYVNKVADKLFAHDMAFRNKLKIYTLRTPQVNAFTFDDGTVVVTHGLMSQLEDEAQLAFILAHEAVHFKKEHAVTEFVETKDIQYGRGDYRNLSFDEKVLAKFGFSKDQESEADLEGLEIFLKSDYSTESIVRTFDVLQYAYLPFDEVPFDTTMFNDENYVIPGAYFLNEVSEIKVDEDYDDSKSSHPNTEKRRKALKKELKGAGDQTGKSTYLVSKEEFVKYRKIARFEICRQYLLRHNYPKALYNAFLLLREDSNSMYLKKTVGKALYGASKYSNQGMRYEVVNDWEDIEGESQQVYYMLSELSSEELNILALRWNWSVYKDNLDDEELKLIVEDLSYELANEHELDWNSFYKQSKAEKEALKLEAAKEDSLVANTEEEEENLEGLSKLEKIRRKQEQSDDEDEVVSEKDSDYYRFAFLPWRENEVLIAQFEASQEKVDAKKAEKEAREKMTRSEKGKLFRQQQKEVRLQNRYGHAKGFDKVVVVNPMYQRYNERKSEPIRYKNRETVLTSFNEKIQKSATATGLDIEIINPRSINNNQADRFYHHTILNEWISEKIHHEDGMHLVSPIHNEILGVSKYYGTTNFCWIGGALITEKNDAFTTILLYSYVFPAGIIYSLTPKHTTYYFTITYNLKTGNSEMVEFVKIKSKDHKFMQQSNLFYTFQQLKQTR